MPKNVCQLDDGANLRVSLVEKRTQLVCNGFSLKTIKFNRNQEKYVFLYAHLMTKVTFLRDYVLDLVSFLCFYMSLDHDNSTERLRMVLSEAHGSELEACL